MATVNNNVFSLVNEAYQQATGQKTASVIDTNSFVDAGNKILSSQDYTDKYMQILAGRITHTILALRPYYAMFRRSVKDYARGAIQKISYGDMKAEADESFGLVNGQSVDMYKVNKPIVSQKFFYKESPYQFHVSTQRINLKNAFLNDADMAAFIRSYMLAITNNRVIAIEDLARLTLANMIVRTDTYKVNLLSLYNSEYTETLTAAEALNDANFLRYCVRIIRTISDDMRSPLRVFNDGTITRFTPYEKQDFYMLSMFETAMETVSSYAAYHASYVTLDGYEKIPFWQTYGASFADKSRIIGTNENGVETTVNGVVAVICDTDAQGVFPREEWASTTPFNSAGGYSNTYWHGNGTWFNDPSENFVVFYIADETPSETISLSDNNANNQNDSNANNQNDSNVEENIEETGTKKK